MRTRTKPESLKLASPPYILALVLLLAPRSVQAQCQPMGGSPQSQASGSHNPSPLQPEFFDEPKFTVAGVTEAAGAGGHGSDTILRTREALAKETVSLSKSKESGNSLPASSIATEKSLREMAHDPKNFDANHRLGKLLLDNGNPREAVPYLEQASRLSPGDYENTYELALAYAAAYDYERSRTNARALLTREDRAEVHHLLGDVEEKLGNPLEAVGEYQRAAELNPSEPNLFDWGTELLLHRASEPAIEVFTKGNHLFPRSARLLVALGVAWYSRGSADKAAACLCQASDLNPDDPTPYLFLGKMETVEPTQLEGTLERLARFAKLQPENALANYYYAVSLWSHRRSPEDIETSTRVEHLLVKAVHLDPGLGGASLQLGILYAERKDFPDAIAAYQKATEANPRLAAAHYRLAQAYRQTGEKLKAQHELDVYQQVSKETAAQVERERHELQQFVYTLRDRTAAGPPQ